jgi:general secretion pathway protein K
MRVRLRNEDGVALLVVLWVLILLSVIVGDFCSSARTEVNIARNLKDETQAYYIARAGINRGITEIEAKGRMTPNPTLRQGGAGAQKDIEPKVNLEMPAIAFGEGQFQVTIQNESGKVNINRAGNLLLKMMLNGFSLDDQQQQIIVDSILDWRDKDSFVRPNGAEDDYYLSLAQPYRCKNSDFESIEELLLVRGVTPEIFYGGLRELVTVYPPQDTSVGSEQALGPSRKEFTFNFNMININAAPYRMILSLPKMSDELAKKIMESRNREEFKSLSELLAIVGSEVYAAIIPYLTLESLPFYTLQSRGMVEGTRVKHIVKVLVEINTRIKGGYRIISWSDDSGYSMEEYRLSLK